HPRSTIATTTEIHDHLRVLWARAGTPHCPEHGEELKGGDASSIARALLADVASEGKAPKGWLVVPLLKGGPDSADAQKEIGSSREALVAAGYARLLVDGEEWKLDGDLAAVPTAAREDLVVDRLSFTESSKARLAEAIEGASEFAAGRFSVVLKGGPRLEYSTHGSCTQCGFEWATGMEPRHFSFNTLVGACPTCSGLGEVVRCDAEMLVDRPEEILLGGADSAISGKLGRYLIKGKGYYEMLLRAVAKSHKIPIEKKPFQDLKPEHKDLILYGKGARAEYKVSFERTAAHHEIHEEFTSEWVGLCGQVDAWHKKSEDPGWTEVLETVMSRKTCRGCEGERLAPGPRAVMVGDLRLPELLGLTVEEALAWVTKLKVKKSMQEAIAPVLGELRSRLGLLDRVG
ncbi:MAG: hypothetical protein KDB61_14145, partial [Planctomycetes bacterium]|nr:hypothetical protein [Planctomycetota bacterium]